MKRPTHIAFLLPFGELKDAFFPDTLLSELAANVEDQGHRASVIRVYYDGHSATADAEVSRRLLEHLNAIEADVVVLDRLFEPQPLVDWQSAASSRRVVVVARGDTLVPLEGVNLIIGAVPGTMRKGATRRVPTPPDLALALRRLISALEAGADPAEIPGVGVVESDSIRGDASIERATREGAYRAVTQETVIALGDPPPVLHRALHGNAGCPYGRNPLEQPHYARVTLPESLPIARLGCAFCGFGGDYEKRQNTDVVGDLVEQAAFWSSHTPGLESFVLSDQYAIPYLEQLLVAAQQAGVPPVRWLFPCRADTLVAQRDKLESAIRTAQASEYVLEVFLTGFEAFSDTELARYNKGHDSSQSIAAIQLMRELGARYPGGFAYAQAKAHSLILFNPWTTPEDVLESARALRRHGLGELFRDVAYN